MLIHNNRRKKRKTLPKRDLNKFLMRILRKINKDDKKIFNLFCIEII